MKAFVILTLLVWSADVYGGEIADLHRKLYENKARDRSNDEVRSKDHGITEIGLERTLCFGTCPVYTVIMKSDGSLRYYGKRYVEKKGKLTGQVSKSRFNQLAQFIKDADFMELEHSYDRPVTDLPTVYTKVVMDGRQKVVRNYANAGPTKLWAIEQLIDKLLAEAEWDTPNDQEE